MCRDARSSLVIPAAVAALLCLLVGTVLVGCSGSGSEAGSGGSVATSDTPGPVRVPPKAVLDKPETAVISYLNWISAAYRVLRSDVASQTFTNYEEVRINSYVQYNRQEGRAIDQALTKLDISSVKSEGGTATVTAREDWRYRYISLATKRYSSAEMTASYDTTYTVVKGADGLWRVDRVEASPKVPVK